MIQWTVYKNDVPISQARAWHIALNNLVIMERLIKFEIGMQYPGIVLVHGELNLNRYKITKDRG